MATKLSQITASPGNTASGDFLVGVTAANLDVLFSPAQLAAGLGISIVAGKTLTASNSLTLAGTDGATLNIGAGGTLGSNAFTSTPYAPITSAALVTPALGVATGTSLALNGATLGSNILAITGPFEVSGADETSTPFGSSNITFAVQRNAVTTSTFPFFNGYFNLNYTGTNTSASFVSLESDAAVGSGVSTNVSSAVALTGSAIHNGTATLALAQGSFTNILNKSTGTITTAQALQVAITNNTGGTITTATGFQIKQPKGGASSVWTNINGVEIQDQKPTGTNTVTNPPVALLIDSQTGSGAFSIKQVGSGLIQLAVLNAGGLLQTDTSGNVTANATANAATIASSFSADHRLTLTLGGTTYYLPVSTTAW